MSKRGADSPEFKPGSTLRRSFVADHTVYLIQVGAWKNTAVGGRQPAFPQRDVDQKKGEELGERGGTVATDQPVKNEALPHHSASGERMTNAQGR
jgi:hypothetical protein